MKQKGMLRRIAVISIAFSISLTLISGLYVVLNEVGVVLGAPMSAYIIFRILDLTQTL